MERDFMGLGAKMKQEIPEETTGSGVSSTMEWSFSKKGSVPQLFSFDSPKEDKPKVGYEALASAGLITITTTEAAESYPRVLQNNVDHERRRFRYTPVSLPPMSFDSPSLHHHHEARRLTRPIPSNQTVSVAMSSPVHQSFGSPAGRNLISPISTQPLSLASTVQAENDSNCVVGTTEVRNTFTATAAPAQLTIFYAGSVCVFDDISPDKAQAIMLLAGDGPPLGPPPTVPASPVQTIAVRPSIVDCSVVNRYNTTSSFSSPISSVSALKSVGVPVCPDDAAAARTIITLTSPTSKEEPPKTVNSVGPVPATPIPSGSGVPQFRKASLARFLEKRKERVLTASPYACDKKQSQDCSTPGSANTAISMNSSGSWPLPATS